MKKLPIRIASILLLALPMFAAENAKSPYSQKERVFHRSLFTLWLSASADVTTSLIANGRPGISEANPLIGKQFGARGLALEFGSRGILATVEMFVRRRHPSASRYFSAGNAGLSVGSWIAAVNNARLLMRSAASGR